MVSNMAKNKYRCEECSNEWEATKPPGEMEDGPRCSECGSYSVEQVPEPPQGGDPRRERLKSALEATPDVGEKWTNYVLDRWDRFDAVKRDESRLMELLQQVKPLSQTDAKWLVKDVFESVDPPTIERQEPSDDGGSDGGSDLVETVRAMREMREMAAPEQDAANGQEIAEAVAEAVRPVMQQQSEMQQMLADAVADDGGKSERVERLENQIESLKEELAEKRRSEEVERLEKKIKDLEQKKVNDEEVLRMRETRELLNDAPRTSAEVANELETPMMALIDRLEGIAARAEGETHTSPTFNPNAAPHNQQQGRQRQRRNGRQDGRRRQRQTQQQRAQQAQQQQAQSGAGADDAGQETAGEHDGPGEVTQEDADAALEQLGIETDGAANGGEA